ncbi:MAG: lipocalin family protein [Desulfuromonadales bacterium]|nr:lipocalin family protein [Desulfuromonadales bacterium]
MLKRITAAVTLLLSGCVNIPAGITPVEPFDLDRYLGRWYEIARLDHSFERGLSDVTADYSLREDGMVRVVNRGYDQANKRWKEAEGKARFVREPTRGFLKVSFFGPFYGSYIIFELDQEDYNYALISGPNTSYLWILARQPTLTDDIKQRLIATAQEKGFAVSELIFVEQTAAAEGIGKHPGSVVRLK